MLDNNKESKKKSNAGNLTPVENNYQELEVREPKTHDPIIEIILDSLTESTAHGIGPIVKRQHSFIRSVWIACLILSAAVCAYMIALAIMAFFSYEVVSKTEKIYLYATDFPAVTICNMNAFMKNTSLSFVNEVLVKNYIIDGNNSRGSFSNMKGDLLVITRYIAGLNAINPNLTDEFRKSLGYNMSDMLFSCIYSFVGCTADDFNWYYDALYGNCFTFNSGKFANNSRSPIKRSTRSGSVNGLIIELFIYEPINMSSLAVSSGIHLAVHNQSRFPYFFDGISLVSGTQTNVEINRQFSSHLESPYSECTQVIDENHPSQIVRYLINADYAYTQQDCFFWCFQFYLIEKCNCFDQSIKLPYEVFLSQNIQPCLNSSQLECETIEYLTFFASGVPQSCQDQCPLECDSINYGLSTSSTDYPSIVYANSLMENPRIKAKYAANLSQMSYESLRRSMVQISVYYNNLGYDQYKEIAKMEVIDLVSNIGGTLGLFLGMSFLSIVEFLDILLQICFLKKTKTTKVEQVKY